MNIGLMQIYRGYNSCKKLQIYLEEDGRALARDFYNLSWDERSMEYFDEDLKYNVEWADEMDLTRRVHKNDRPVRTDKSIAYFHFILSPHPDNKTKLETIRALSGRWALSNFGEYQIAIFYHNDNEKCIMHSHIIVNSTNLRTGNHLTIKNINALELNAQKLALDEGLSLGPFDLDDQAGEMLYPGKRMRLSTSLTFAERNFEKRGTYSWMVDLRSRVNISKLLSLNVDDFATNCRNLGIGIRDSSADYSDWVFYFPENSRHCARGSRLGYEFTRSSLLDYFKTSSAAKNDAFKGSPILKNAMDAIDNNDLLSLDRLSKSLEKACL